MGLSGDLITNIAFGLVMVIIGVIGIWLVKWSTDRVIRAGREQGEAPLHVIGHAYILTLCVCSLRHRELKTPETRRGP